MTSLKHKKEKLTRNGKRIKLRYILDIVPGYSRVRRGRGFYYTNREGNRVNDLAELERFRTLAIPPVWRDVWISPSKKGHLQATGVDQQGRKQYLYHQGWTTEQQRTKLKRVLAFGKALPAIRRRIAKDRRQQTSTKERTTAIALRTTEETLIRIGNDQYLHRYGSHGLTTLKKKHITVSGNEVVFRFKGKKGVRQEISVRNAKLANDLTALVQLRGAYLFQYIENDQPVRLRSEDVNAYIRHHGGLFSSKDYRTWYASFWAFRFFARCGGYASEQEREAKIVSVLDKVSNRLGNTRAVCKAYYVPDSIIQAYKSGTLLPSINKHQHSGRLLPKKETEQRLLAFLEHAATMENS